MCAYLGFLNETISKQKSPAYIRTSHRQLPQLFVVEHRRKAVNMSRIVKVILIVSIIYCAYSEAQFTEQNCEENQEWNSCGSACEPSCANPNPQICTFNCVIGCRCKSGFLRDANSNCVTQENCPTD